MVGGADLLRKTLAILSFQIVQLVSMVRDTIALEFGTVVFDMLAHQAPMERSAAHSVIERTFHIPHSLLV